MKRTLKALLYLFLSAFLFFSGVLLEVSPAKVIDQIKKDVDDTFQDDNAKDTDLILDDVDQDVNEQDDTSDVVEKQDTFYEYYYTVLDEQNKLKYSMLEKAVSRMEKSVVIPDITSDEIGVLYQYVHNDHPEFFWMENNYSYRTLGNDVEVLIKYTCTEKEKEKRETVINQQVNEILAGMPMDSGDYEKIKYVFETLVDMTSYDLNAPDNQNIYSVFGNWVTVCAGYAKATQHLLNQAGIECIYVTGDAGEYHAWNIVKCDGNYYYVDTTWGDPLYQEIQGVESQYKRVAYEYLCCPESLLFRTHTPDAVLNLPKCEDSSLEYYRLAGRYFESYDRSQMIELLKNDYLQGVKHTELQYGSKDVFDQAHADFNDAFQEFSTQVSNETGKDVSEIQCMYGGNDVTAVFTVDWK